MQAARLFRPWHRPILAITMLMALPATARSGTLRPIDKNIEALHNFGVATASILVAHAGIIPSVLDYSGTVSDTGWTLHLQGSYGPLDLDLSFVGTFDISQSTGTFTAIDDVGGSIWDGGGSWSFASIDDDTDDFGWFYATNVENLINRDVQHVPGVPDFDGYRIICAPDTGDPSLENCFNLGFYVNTISGVKDSVVKEANSVFVRPRIATPPLNFKTSFELPADHVRLTGTVNFETGGVAGTIVVPEPSTLMLVAGGLLLSLTRLAARGRGIGKRAFPNV
jgi:hypothetical protein